MKLLSKQAQIRYFVDWFAGRPVPDLPVETFFSGAYRFVAKSLAGWERIRPDEGPAAIWEVFGEFSNNLATLFGSDGEDLCRTLRAAIDPDLRFASLAEIADGLPPIAWAWENWLPLGMLSLLAARPGTGKSLIALDLCRRVISGETWPDGSAQPLAGRNCIYVDAENVPAILNQRAEQWEAWGMDRRKLYPVIPEDEEDIVNLGAERYRDLLNLMAIKLQPALIVVDSLRDILPNGESNVEDVRSTLAFLSSLARSNASTVLVVHHLRKGANSGQLALLDNIDLDQVSGSGYIGGRARVVLGLTKVQTTEEPNKNGPRKIEVVKTNLGEYPKDMGITFEATPPAGLRLTWSANAPKRYTDEPDTGPTIRDQAKDWLISYLETAGEPVPPKQVETDAQEAGISRATLFRARADLEGQVINSRGRKAGGNGWMLANDNADSPQAE